MTPSKIHTASWWVGVLTAVTLLVAALTGAKIDTATAQQVASVVVALLAAAGFVHGMSQRGGGSGGSA